MTTRKVSPARRDGMVGLRGGAPPAPGDVGGTRGGAGARCREELLRSGGSSCCPHRGQDRRGGREHLLHEWRPSFVRRLGPVWFTVSLLVAQCRI